MYSTIEGKYLSAALITAGGQAALDVRNTQFGVMVLTWASAGAADAVVKLQESMDQTTWIDIAGATQTIGAATGTKKFEFASAIHPYCPYLRAFVTINSETTAILDLRHYFVGAR